MGSTDERRAKWLLMAFKYREMLIVLAIVCGICAPLEQVSLAEDVKIVCPSPPPPMPKLARAAVYDNVPFKSGEKLTYEVTYGGIFVGFAILEVKPPQMYKGFWHRIFHAEARTGEWYEGFFKARDEAESISRPHDFGVAKFYLQQDEAKIFGKRLQQKKWLDFEHDRCRVRERVSRVNEADESEEVDLAFGSIDALGLLYEVRTVNFEIGKVHRAPIYTDKKNWWLEATPILKEKITTKAGTFDTVKMKLQTFLGKDLQQKGEVFMWVDTSSPLRAIVQIQGEIKLGSVWLRLTEAKRGN